MVTTLVNVIFWTLAEALHSREAIQRKNCNIDNIAPAIVPGLPKSIRPPVGRIVFRGSA